LASKTNDVIAVVTVLVLRQDRQKYLDLMEDELKTEVQGVFHLFAGKEATIRLMDPALNDILPRTNAQIDDVARKLEMVSITLFDLSYICDRSSDGLCYEKPEAQVVRAIRLLTQSNPEIGLRGCRLGILYPELVEMQTRAIMAAAMGAAKAGDEGFRVQILIPMVSTDHEIEDIAPVIKTAAAEVSELSSCLCCLGYTLR
jgi:pyruvate, orthophosphate dikinase